MTFERQTDAKRFVMGKVLEQAEREGITLTNAERHMLAWSESDPEVTADAVLAEALAQEMSDEAFESKVSGLIRRAFEREVAADKNAKSVYREARAKLGEGDHYIVVMMDEAIGRRLRSWWRL